MERVLDCANTPLFRNLKIKIIFRFALLCYMSLVKFDTKKYCVELIKLIESTLQKRIIYRVRHKLYDVFTS